MTMPAFKDDIQTGVGRPSSVTRVKALEWKPSPYRDNAIIAPTGFGENYVISSDTAVDLWHTMGKDFPSLDAAKAAVQADFEQRILSALSTGFANPDERVAIVPLDATPKMVSAAFTVEWNNEDENSTVHNIWHAMVAASQSEPNKTRSNTLSEPIKAEFKIMELLTEKARGQVEYWREKQDGLPCPEDMVDADGNYTPLGDDAALEFGRINGRYSEADWWQKTIACLVAQAGDSK